MSSARSLLFIFVTAPDPEAGGANGSRQGCREPQTLGLRGEADGQTLPTVTDTRTIPRRKGFRQALLDAR